METTKARPTSIAVIGWIFIVVAVLMIFSGAMGFVAYMFIEKAARGEFPAGETEFPEGVPATLPLMFKVFSYFDILAIVQVIFATVILVAGIQFLRLRAWARTALEVVSWFALVYIVGFGVFWLYSWIGMTSQLPAGEMEQFPSTFFKTFGAIMGVIVIATFAVPTVVIIKFLRGETIRKAVS